MKMKLAGCAAIAAALAAPAFAQTNVQTPSGVTVTSGTGVVVTPGAPGMAPAGATVAVTPGTVHTVPQASIPGAVVAQADVHTSASGNTTTTVTRYWVNVPPGAEANPYFQRWQRLK